MTKQVYCIKKMKHLSTVILNAYCNCNFYIANIDKIVMELAVKSHGVGSDFDVFTIRQVEAVMRLMDRKLKLLYLIFVIEQMLANLSPMSRLLLKNKYINKKPARKTIIMLRLEFCDYQKKLQKAILDFGEKLVKNGNDDKWFRENYFDQRWIRKLYFSLKEGEKIKWIKKYIPPNQ